MARSALITGSSSGIGLAIAKSLAASGANVMLNGLADSAEAERLCSEITRQSGVKARFHPANMLDVAAIESLIQETVQELGSLDILVNNAGIQHTAATHEFPTEQWDNIIGINLSSAFHTIRCAIPLMRAKNWGRVINIASVHGLVASVEKSAYVAAKHGLVGLTKVVALENAEFNITVNAICPGWVLTPLVEKQIERIAGDRKIDIDQASRELL
ncbi:MAG TPA: 3-hydroxybutyrate dehydrogenase, partial [Chroococcales cyanobacterium]